MEIKSVVKKKLLSLADPKLLAFEQSLNMKSNDGKVKQIGIKIPILRSYAKELSKQYELSFLLEKIDEEYYEEIMLKGFLIGSYRNLSYSELEKNIQYFVPKISDWGMCDTFCAGLKITKKYQNEIWILIHQYLESKQEFEVRFALVMTLNYFMDEEHIHEIFDIINHVTLEDYYVKMANAWLISYCIIKFYEETILFLKKT